MKSKLCEGDRTFEKCQTRLKTKFEKKNDPLPFFRKNNPLPFFRKNDPLPFFRKNDPLQEKSKCTIQHFKHFLAFVNSQLLTQG